LRQHLGFEHGFPLIRNLRASAQRSTSVLFSFVLSLLIMAVSFTIRQSKTILARSQPDRKRFAVHGDEKLTPFIELETAIHAASQKN